MARITIASLQSRVAELETALAEAQAALATARTELDAYQVAERPSRQAPAPATRPRNVHTYTRCEPSAEQIAYRAACQRAREFAMATGRVVAVGRD